MNTNTLERMEPAVAGSIGPAADAAVQRLATSDLEEARLYMNQTRHYVVGATRGLSDAQWKFKPAPDRWSILEIVEHMVAVQERVLGPIWERLANAPASPGDRDYKQVDRLVLYQFPNRLNRFPSPEQPTGLWEPAVASDRLLKNYGRLGEYLESAPDLRQRVLESRPLKAVSEGLFDSMDGYQWLLAAAAHNERHTKQILEVKADPNFPAA
jgi:hypothetical protein